MMDPGLGTGWDFAVKQAKTKMKIMITVEQMEQWRKRQLSGNKFGFFDS